MNENDLKHFRKVLEGKRSQASADLEELERVSRSDDAQESSEERSAYSLHMARIEDLTTLEDRYAEQGEKGCSQAGRTQRQEEAGQECAAAVPGRTDCAQAARRRGQPGSRDY